MKNKKSQFHHLHELVGEIEFFDSAERKIRPPVPLVIIANGKRYSLRSEMTLAAIEKKAIATALQECGSVSQAAKRLGIHRRTLQRKLRRK